MVRVKQLLGRKGAEVWSVDADEPVLEAIQMMADKHVGALMALADRHVIIEKGRVVWSGDSAALRARPELPRPA